MENYMEGENEKILGQSQKNLNIARRDVVIAPKVYSRFSPGRNNTFAPAYCLASARKVSTTDPDSYEL